MHHDLKGEINLKNHPGSEDNLKFGIALKNVGPRMSFTGDGLSFRGIVGDADDYVDANADREVEHIASRRIANVEDILQVQEAAELHEHITDLQTDLFRKSVDSKGQRFDPARCILTLMTLRSTKIKQSKQQANEDRYSLPPLYRT